MANNFINVYTGNPTEGGTDGTIISTDGAQTAPLVVSLDASIEETKKTKLAVRCESGYQTTAGTIIQDNGDTNDHWKLSLTENGTYTDSIVFSNGIDTGNAIFYAQTLLSN